MMTGVEARKTMKVSTLQYCSVLMLVKMQPRKAHEQVLCHAMLLLSLPLLLSRLLSVERR